MKTESSDSLDSTVIWSTHQVVLLILNSKVKFIRLPGVEAGKRHQMGWTGCVKANRVYSTGNYLNFVLYQETISLR